MPSNLKINHVNIFSIGGRSDRVLDFKQCICSVYLLKTYLEASAVERLDSPASSL